MVTEVLVNVNRVLQQELESAGMEPLKKILFLLSFSETLVLALSKEE